MRSVPAVCDRSHTSQEGARTLLSRSVQLAERRRGQIEDCVGATVMSAVPVSLFQLARTPWSVQEFLRRSAHQTINTVTASPVSRNAHAHWLYSVVAKLNAVAALITPINASTVGPTQHNIAVSPPIMPGSTIGRVVRGRPPDVFSVGSVPLVMSAGCCLMRFLSGPGRSGRGVRSAYDPVCRGLPCSGSQNATRRRERMGMCLREQSPVPFAVTVSPSSAPLAPLSVFKRPQAE